MARMAKRGQNGIPGTYEIWRQSAGGNPERMLWLYSHYDAETFLDMMMRKERSMGFSCTRDDVDGGFIASVKHRRKRGTRIVPAIHYWYEEVMDEDTLIDESVKCWLAIASATAVAEVREQEASAAADFQRDAE